MPITQCSARASSRPRGLDGILVIFLLLLRLFVFQYFCSACLCPLHGIAEATGQPLALSLESCEKPGCWSAFDLGRSARLDAHTAKSFLHCPPQSIQQLEHNSKSLVVNFMLIFVVLALPSPVPPACYSLWCFDLVSLHCRSLFVRCSNLLCPLSTGNTVLNALPPFKAVSSNLPLQRRSFASPFAFPFCWGLLKPPETK